MESKQRIWLMSGIVAVGLAFLYWLVKRNASATMQTASDGTPSSFLTYNNPNGQTYQGTATGMPVLDTSGSASPITIGGTNISMGSCCCDDSGSSLLSSPDALTALYQQLGSTATSYYDATSNAYAAMGMS